jgi:multidrug efflux pump subunit AcrA (membrane-fusion protein)
MNRHPYSPVGFCLLLAVCMGIGGCSRQGKQGAEAPAPTVSVSYPLQREVTDHADYTGRTAAVDSVQVRAPVSGHLQTGRTGPSRF